MIDDHASLILCPSVIAVSLHYAEGFSLPSHIRNRDITHRQHETPSSLYKTTVSSEDESPGRVASIHTVDDEVDGDLFDIRKQWKEVKDFDPAVFWKDIIQDKDNEEDTRDDDNKEQPESEAQLKGNANDGLFSSLGDSLVSLLKNGNLLGDDSIADILANMQQEGDDADRRH